MRGIIQYLREIICINLKSFFVVEEKRPGLESLIRDALYAVVDRPVIVGKQDAEGAPLVPGHGALDPLARNSYTWLCFRSNFKFFTGSGKLVNFQF